MPRLYASVDALLTHPLAGAQGLATAYGGISQPGSVVPLLSMLTRASARVDTYCRRRLGAAGTTTISTDSASGVSSLPVASTIGFDGTPDMSILVGTGATQELVQIGGQTIPVPGMPGLPGTLTLYGTLVTQYAHGAGEPVQGLYHEQRLLTGGATHPLDAAWDLTQQGQIASAHAPNMGQGSVIRTVFLRAYPISWVQTVTITYPWANAQDYGVPSDLFLQYSEGWYRFPLGYYVPDNAIVTTTYQGGYTTLPDDLVEAVILETLAEYATMFNPMGVANGGGISYGQAGGLLSQRACSYLAEYRNLALG